MELVTAANNKQIFTAAATSPADSIYVPLTGLVSIRWGRDFFELCQLPELLKLAHKAGKKVYPVINGHPPQAQLAAYHDAARRIYEAGADGVVVGSPEIIHWIKRELKPKPPFLIIASSSAKAICRQDIDFLHSLGADRVIISRLHTLSEVKELASRSAPQLELFVHGLICPCWEGQDCLLPLYTYGNEADWGCCLGSAEPGLSVACSKYQTGSDATRLWDMRVQSDLSLLPRILQSGVHSIKVIPATKSVSDWQKTIAVWRQALDNALADEAVDDTVTEELGHLSPLPIDFNLRRA